MAGSIIVGTSRFTHARKMGTFKEGWLRKNHKSGSYLAANARRWFVSDGFHVFYYDDNTRSTIKGHFDLRNVIGIRPCTDPSAPEAVDIDVAEGAPQKVTKTIIVSFVMDVADKATWLQLWCSAIAPEYVDIKLRGWQDAQLNATFNQEHATQAYPHLGRRLQRTYPFLCCACITLALPQDPTCSIPNLHFQHLLNPTQ